MKPNTLIRSDKAHAVNMPALSPKITPGRA